MFYSTIPLEICVCMYTHITMCVCAYFVSCLLYQDTAKEISLSRAVVPSLTLAPQAQSRLSYLDEGTEGDKNLPCLGGPSMSAR